MFFIDNPYVSDFLRTTIRSHHLPVVLTEQARQFGFDDRQYRTLSEEEAVALARSSTDLRIYTNSENAIGWIARHLAFTGLPAKINLFKDKVAFRRLLKPLCPDFFFKEVAFAELQNLRAEDLPLPCVLKPAVGFFSMGVHKINSSAELHLAVAALHEEFHAQEALYPREVLNSTTCIIEQSIEGDEFAIDAYYDAAGEPVILGIFQHIFSSDADVSDRVYLTSSDILGRYLAPCTEFLQQVGRLAGVRNFPVHVEVRVDRHGTLLPIEINPMRFGGWCTTADLTAMAYGFNPYLAYCTNQRPDWKTLLHGKEGTLYGLIVLDNSTGVDGKQIAAFDYARLQEVFHNPLAIRKVDFRKYPVFGFVFTETPADNFSELDRILRSDLREFIR